MQSFKDNVSKYFQNLSQSHSDEELLDVEDPDGEHAEEHPDDDDLMDE